MPPSPTESILDAAMGVFFRFGFKKASMEDVAKAAGLSRQGLYLKFSTKEQLFKAALEHLIARLLDETRVISTRGDLRVDARLMAIFETLHGGLLESGSRADVAELLELARSKHGDLVVAFERDFIGIVATLLTQTGVARKWAPVRLSAQNLAEHLLMAASGIKASVTTVGDYRARLAVAIALVARGEPSPGPNSRNVKKDRQ